MTTPCDILLFGTMGDIGPAVKCSLEAQGLKVALVDFPQNTFRDEPGYRRELAKAIALHSPSVIWPIGNQLAMARAVAASKMCDRQGCDVASADLMAMEESVVASKACSGVIPPGIIVPIAGQDTIALLDSKVRVSALAKKLGIPQPRIYTSPEEVASFPMIFKREHSFGGSGVYRPRSREALDKLIRQEGGKYLMEEFVEGYDISVDCLRIGSVFKAGCYRCLGKVQGQGPATVREAIDCPEAIGYARKILEHLNYRGVCGFDFRVGAIRDYKSKGEFVDSGTMDCKIGNSKGALYFLEANPRFTGGISTQIASGFDIPCDYFAATASISTIAPIGRAATWKQARAGASEVK